MACISSSIETMESRTGSAPSSCLSLKPSSLKRKRPPSIEIPHVLQELKADKLRLRDLTPENGILCAKGVGVGVYSVKGKKKFMEDTHNIVSCLQGSSRKAFFGVYDGHGGRRAAEFAADKLKCNVLEMMQKCSSSDEKKEAIRAAYLKTDTDFLKEGAVSGACCVTALIHGKEIIVSNLGDCRAVLCRCGVAEALTTDHKAARDDERKRIENKGGYVEYHRGAWRVHGILSVSRSIGDAHLKNWVIPEPDTKLVNLTPDMEFLVLASDGLWNVVSNQETVDIVSQFLFGEKHGGCSSDPAEGNDENLGCVNDSPPMIQRDQLVKQTKEVGPSPKLKKTFDDDFLCVSLSPPLKSRRISLVKKINMKTESSVSENTDINKMDASGSIIAACKELVSIAANRGSLDDITVMIIDLNRFKSEI